MRHRCDSYCTILNSGSFEECVDGAAHADAAVDEPVDVVIEIVGAGPVALAVLGKTDGSALLAGILECEFSPVGVLNDASLCVEFCEKFKVRRSGASVDVHLVPYQVVPCER